ncbi:hypothetical protein GMMP13_240032 [Candidatus Magnetomoraceae bacterium gMMP-13]
MELLEWQKEYSASCRRNNELSVVFTARSYVLHGKEVKLQSYVFFYFHCIF